MTELVFPIPSEKLLFHRNTMKLIRTLDIWEQNHASSVLSLDADNPFIDSSGKLDNFIFIEYIAQLAALYKGYETIINNAPIKTGYLVGIKIFRFLSNAFLGDIINLTIDVEFEFGNSMILNGKVIKNSEILSLGSIKVWENDAIIQSNSKNEKHNPNTELFKDISEENGKIHWSKMHQAIHSNLINYEVRENSIFGEFCFSKDFLGFDGHFPGNPIFPGVLTIYIVLVLSEIALQRKLEITQIDNVKFSSPMFPNKKIAAEVKILKEDEKYSIQSKLYVENKTTAILSLCFKEI